VSAFVVCEGLGAVVEPDAPYPEQDATATIATKGARRLADETINDFTIPFLIYSPVELNGDSSGTTPVLGTWALRLLTSATSGFGEAVAQPIPA